MRSSSAHKGKIIIFWNISLFLDKNYTDKLRIDKINWKVWNLFKPTFVKLAPGPIFFNLKYFKKLPKIFRKKLEI